MTIIKERMYQKVKSCALLFRCLFSVFFFFGVEVQVFVRGVANPGASVVGLLWNDAWRRGKKRVERSWNSRLTVRVVNCRGGHDTWSRKKINHRTVNGFSKRLKIQGHIFKIFRSFGFLTHFLYQFISPFFLCSRTSFINSALIYSFFHSQIHSWIHSTRIAEIFLIIVQ